MHCLIQWTLKLALSLLESSPQIPGKRSSSGSHVIFPYPWKFRDSVAEKISMTWSTSLYACRNLCVFPTLEAQIPFAAEIWMFLTFIERITKYLHFAWIGGGSPGMVPCSVEAASGTSASSELKSGAPFLPRSLRNSERFTSSDLGTKCGFSNSESMNQSGRTSGSASRGSLSWRLLHMAPCRQNPRR